MTSSRRLAARFTARLSDLPRSAATTATRELIFNIFHARSPEFNKWHGESGWLDGKGIQTRPWDALGTILPTRSIGSPPQDNYVAAAHFAAGAPIPRSADRCRA
ncbi:MAG TPA: hypothetical protein VGP63_13260 [Planctomycetaceae bacterium]|nr:hypothetical protein [Planctomycetaceae bacterium]